MKKRTRKIEFSLKSETVEQARELARLSGKTLSEYTEEVLRDYLPTQTAPGEFYVRSTIKTSRLLYDIRDLNTVMMNMLDVFIRFYLADNMVTAYGHQNKYLRSDGSQIHSFWKEVFSSSIKHGGRISDFRKTLSDVMGPIEERYQAYIARRNAEIEEEINGANDPLKP